MLIKKKVFKNFWGLFAGILTATAITTGSVLSNNNHYNGLNNSLLNQSSGVPSSDDSVNQSLLLQQNIKNNNLVENSNNSYFNVKYNNQIIYSSSLNELKSPYSIFFRNNDSKNLDISLKNNILLNLRHQGDLQKDFIQKVNEALNLPKIGSKYDVYQINGIYPKLSIYQKNNYYFVKSVSGDINLGPAKKAEDVNFKNVSSVNLAIKGSFFDKYNISDVVPTFQVNGPNKDYFAPNIVSLLNSRLKQFNLYKPYNRLQEWWSNIQIVPTNNYNWPIFSWNISEAKSNGIWASTNSIDGSSFFVDLGKKLSTTEINSSYLETDKKIYLPLTTAVNTDHAWAIKPKNSEDSKYFILYFDWSTPKNSLSNKFYYADQNFKSSYSSTLSQLFLLDPKKENIKFKNLKIENNTILNDNFKLNKTNLEKDDILLPNNLNIAKINFVNKPHFYSNFLPFLSKQIVIDPNTGISNKSNPIDNGVYSNLDAIKNLKFAFNDDFAYLINQLNVYNYYLQNSKSKKITDPRVQTFKSIIQNASKPQPNGDNGVYKADLNFLYNFYNLKYDAQTINNLIDARFDVANSNGYLIDINQTTTKLSNAYSKVFANPQPAVLGKLYENKDFVNEAAKTTFNALMDLPTLVNEALSNKEITANVNYGVAGKDIRIPIWKNDSFQPIPEFPNLPDPNQNILYLSSANTQNNITQITINNLAFDNSIATDDSKNIDNSILASSINEFDKKHPTQDTLKLVNNSAIQYTLNYRKDYKNFSFTPKTSNATEINNGVPVIDIDAGFHRDWLATQYEESFISTQAQKSINNYFGQIDPTYLRNGGFVLYSTFGVNEVLNDKNNEFFSAKLQTKLSNFINKYKLDTKPNDYTGSFYRIVRLNNANDLGNQQRAEHPAPFVWYLGDVQDNPANSYYLMQFEAPNKIYDLNNLNIDWKTKSLYFENKSVSFVAYSKNLGDEMRQSQKLIFEPKGTPMIKTTNDQEFLDVSFEKPLGVQFWNLSESIVPSKIASGLVGLYAKDYIYSANISKARQNDRDTLNFQIGLSKKADISPISNLINRNLNAINFLNQSKTISNEDNSTLGNPQDDPNFPKMQPDWTGIISFPIQNNKLNYKEWWYIPYKVTNLSDNKKHVELLWNQSPNRHNLTLTVFSPDRDIWMDTLINDLQNIFFKPAKDTNGNQINYSFNSNIKDTLVVNSDGQTTNPWFDVNISTSNTLGGTNNPESVNSEASNSLSSGAQAGIGIGVTGSVVATAGTVIFIHRKRNKKLLSNLKKSKTTKSSGDNK